MTFWESKDPNDIDDFALDWTNQLKGEQLTAAEWSFVSAAGAAIEASSFPLHLLKSVCQAVSRTQPQFSYAVPQPAQDGRSIIPSNLAL
jgi:hypothetical protein